MSPSRSEKIRGHGEHLLDLFVGLKGKYAVMRPIVFDQEVVGRVGAERAGHGLQILQNALALSCIQDIAKLTLDAGKKNPSVAGIVGPLEEDDSLRSEFRNSYAVWVVPKPETDDPEVHKALERMEEREERERREQFDGLIQDLVESWNQLRASDALTNFKTLRDKIIAHSDLYHDGQTYRLIDIGELGLQWGDIGRIMRSLERIVHLITMVTRGAHFDFQMLSENLEETAVALWVR